MRRHGFPAKPETQGLLAGFLLLSTIGVASCGGTPKSGTSEPTDSEGQAAETDPSEKALSEDTSSPVIGQNATVAPQTGPSGEIVLDDPTEFNEALKGDPAEEASGRRVIKTKFEPPQILVDAEGIDENVIGFSFKNLPAVSASGRRVVFDYQAEDSAMARLNLRIYVLNTANGKVAAEHVVLDQEEWETMAYAEDESEKETLVKRVLQRVEEVNRELGREKWEPMVVEDVAYAPGDQGFEEGLLASGQEIEVQGLTIVYQEPELSVTGPKGKVLAKRAFPQWKTRGKCRNVSFIQQAAVDMDRRVLLVRVAYTGSDDCLAPDGLFHVVGL